MTRARLLLRGAFIGWAEIEGSYPIRQTLCTISRGIHPVTTVPVQRILHLVAASGSAHERAHTSVRVTAASLAQRGVEVHVASVMAPSQAPRNLPAGKPVTDEHGVHYWWFPRRLGRYAVSFPLQSWLTDHIEDFDVVHLHTLFSHAALAAASAARRTGVPYVVEPNGALHEWLSPGRSRFRNATLSLLEGRVLEHAALMRFDLDEELAEALALGVETPTMLLPQAATGTDGRDTRALHRRLDLPPSRRIVLFRGRIDENSGIDILLRAAREILARIEDVVFVIAGDGPSEFVAQAKADAHALGLSSDDVRWAGTELRSLSREDIGDAELFVLPATAENRDVAIVDALAMGIPVVVSHHVQLAADVTRACAGIAVACESGAVAQAISSIMSKPEFAAAMGNWAREYAARRFSPAAVAQELLMMYGRIAGVTSHVTDRIGAVKPAY